MIRYDLETANDWKNALSHAHKTPGYIGDRVITSMSPSQLESKHWLVSEMIHAISRPKMIALLGGWFAQYTVPLLDDAFILEGIHNYEMDPDVKQMSYKFNKRYKDVGRYHCDTLDVMFQPLPVYRPRFDVVINTSCEHMFPMKGFRELNPELRDATYVLQSTDEDKYDDHINCVSSADELADQADLVDVVFSGAIELRNGMTRFMVIGR